MPAVCKGGIPFELGRRGAVETSRPKLARFLLAAASKHHSQSRRQPPGSRPSSRTPASPHSLPGPGTKLFERGGTPKYKPLGTRAAAYETSPPPHETKLSASLHS